MITTGNNGWIYRPDEARTADEIRKGTNKAFPRSPAYNTSADDWFASFLNNEIGTNRGWAVPDRIEKPVSLFPGVKGDSLTVAWRSQPWGWVVLSVQTIERSGSYYDKRTNRSVTYSIECHEAVDWWIKQRAGSTVTRSTSKKMDSRKEMFKAVQQFMQDPWGEVTKNISAWDRWYGAVKPPAEFLRDLEFPTYTNDPENDHDGIFAVSRGMGKFWRDGEVTEIMSHGDGWTAMLELFDAFRFLGYEVSVNRRFSYQDAESAIESITITIPEDPEELSHSRKTDHSITLHKKGIDVECGYVKDEKRWLERETRKAREVMSLMEEELTTEFTIDL